jgi:ElaB/YqjD/DUF883 family membrane-anchored ribosome-binding protein
MTSRKKATSQFGEVGRQSHRIDLNDIADQAESVANAWLNRAARLVNASKRWPAISKARSDKSVKHQPMATLAMAAVMGFVLGALWKS